MWRKFFPLFAYITAPLFEVGVRICTHSKLIVIDKIFDVLFLATRTYDHICDKKLRCLRDVSPKRRYTRKTGCASFGAWMLSLITTSLPSLCWDTWCVVALGLGQPTTQV